MPKFEFIKPVLQHTASKQFKTIRRFGLYSRCSSLRHEIAKFLLAHQPPDKIKEFDWRNNITDFTCEDPLICNKCGQELTLFSITYRDKSGALKTIEKDDRFSETAPLKPSENTQQNEKPRWRQICLPSMSYWRDNSSRCH